MAVMAAERAVHRMSAGPRRRVTVCCKGHVSPIGFTSPSDLPDGGNGSHGSRCLKPNQIKKSATWLTEVLYFYTTMLHYVNFRGLWWENPRERWLFSVWP
jgi:hypothetical protein